MSEISTDRTRLCVVDKVRYHAIAVCLDSKKNAPPREW